MTSINFFGTHIDCLTKQKLVNIIEDYIEQGKRGYVTFSNVHVVVTAKKNKALQMAVNQATLAAPDGMPLAIIGKLLKEKMERCSGPDMMPAIIESGLEKGYRHYFYGSTEETLAALQQKLKHKYPKIQIVGAYSPPFRPLSEEETSAILHTINNSQADYIWIGLGAPKQEIWMNQQLSNLNKGVMLGVGAAFDFHAGKVSRAPEWMQKSGLEWLHRLLSEPKRLFKRYLTTNSAFIYYLIKERVSVVRK